MFRPYLYRTDDPKLLAVKNAAFDVLYRAARTGLAAHLSEPVTDDAARVLAITGGHCHTGGDPRVNGQRLRRNGMDASVLAARTKQGVISLA